MMSQDTRSENHGGIAKFFTLTTDRKIEIVVIPNLILTRICDDLKIRSLE